MENLLDCIKPADLAKLDKTAPIQAALGERISRCEKHGDYPSIGMRLLLGRGREIWTPCPLCKAEREALEREEESQRLAAAARDRYEEMLGETCIPTRFLGRSFDNFIADTEAKQAAKKSAFDFAENFDVRLVAGSGLIFCGKTGTGKTHLIAAILQHILPRHVGMYITCMGIIRLIRGTWRKDSEKSESDVLNTLESLPLLVIDEVGVQYGTDSEQHIIFEVMDRRYREMKPTILISNQDAAGLKTFVGERTYDRLRETSKLVAFQWESHRSKVSA